ncbi:MAG: virulence protein RhuM/Fic/DOC family protein [Flavobacteriales bacterium]|nr:virulence protein RhuM/Fic/DOC family protein [Flavobacteriales bacterium]
MEEVIIYNTPDDSVEVRVQFDGETVWLTQNQMAELFEQTKQNISLHINNCFREGELNAGSVVKESLITASDGKKYRTKSYNLDVIISVGYRVKSQRGTQFRIWSNNVLRDYLLKGYAVNEKRLQESQQQLQEFKKLAQLQGKVISSYTLEPDESQGLIKVITAYATALDLLDDYDHQRLKLPEKGNEEVVRIDYAEAKIAIQELGKQTQFKGLFGQEKDSSFKSSLDTIYQTFGGKDLYPTTEEKAANLLYFVVKNHSFTDGNKRIAAFIFVWFLERNGLLYDGHGQRLIDDNTLVALTLMIAQSNPADKDMMIKVTVNLLSQSHPYPAV